jgi:hypothetical protein
MTGSDEKGMVILRTEVVYLSSQMAGSQDLFTHLFALMRTEITLAALLLVATGGALQISATDRVLERGWSAVVVRVVEHETGRPIADALIETTCNGSRYQAERPTTDKEGRATVPIYSWWVMLRVTHPGFTNSTVSLYGTNKVSAFCTNAVIKMRRPAR